jgi:hypothetical protein
VCLSFTRLQIRQNKKPKFVCEYSKTHKIIRNRTKRTLETLCSPNGRQLFLAYGSWQWQCCDSSKSICPNFKLPPCYECCLSFGWYPDVRILCADVLERSVSSIFICLVHSLFWVIPRPLNFMCRRFETLFVPKRRHIQFRCRGITENKEHNIPVSLGRQKTQIYAF